MFIIVKLILICLDFNYKKKKNIIALSKKNSNKELIINVATIYIILAIKINLPTLVYRILIKLSHINKTR